MINLFRRFFSIVILFFSSGFILGNKNSKYLLGDGENDAERLAFQNNLVRPLLINALDMASSIEELKGMTIIDYGCGTSAAYPEIRKYIGRSGTYIGIDSSLKQVNFAQEVYPELRYVHGTEDDEEVISLLANADVIFMRYVVMHQKDPEAFIKTIYKNMRKGSILILQDPEATPKRRKEMKKKYPNSEILSDFKTQLGKHNGLDYDFARHYGTIFHQFNPKNLLHTSKSLILKNPYVKALYEGWESKERVKPFFTEDYKRDFKRALDELDDSGTFNIDEIHTLVIQK